MNSFSKKSNGWQARAYILNYNNSAISSADKALFNSFQSNVPSLYPLKTSGAQVFWCFPRGIEM